MNEEIEIAFDNYAYGVRHLIPAYLTGKLKDHAALEDELALILRARDVIEANIDQIHAQSPEAWRRVDELDRLLLLVREELVHQAPYLAAFRADKDIPRTRWWYYLDLITRVQVEEFALPAAERADETTVLPERIVVRQFALTKG